MFKKPKYFFLLTLLTGQLVMAQAEVEEQKFFDVYTRFTANPTSEEAWNKALGDGKEKLYGIQPGDTLWDVSKVLFGDSEFWPKIWSINRDTIYNPHEILPKMTLRFTQGTFANPPSLRVADKNEPVPESEENKLAQKAKGGPAPYRDLPDNLPGLPVVIEKPVAARPTFPEREVKPQAAYNMKYMITSSELSSSGSPVDYGRENFMGSLGDEIFVKSEGGLGEGTYTAVELVKETGDYYIYRYAAELVFKERNSEGLYLFDVVKSQEAVTKNSILIPGHIPKVDLQRSPASDITRHEVIDSPPDSQSQQGGLHNVFFVSGSNLEVGGEYTIFTAPVKKGEREKVAGKGLIVQANSGYGTLLITESKSGVKVGDTIGAR